MDVTELVSRLSGVKKTGADSWLARCPAHQDKSPSFTVKALSDGRILMHCFAGCDSQAVLDSMGLTFSDLFPERLGDFPRARPAFTAIEALKALAAESGVVAIAAADVADGKPISEKDSERVCLAAGRIAAALDFIHGSRR
jgi:hypothetical protein